MSQSDAIPVTLSAQDWSVVRAGLAELPMKLAYPVAVRLEQQLAPHLQPGAQGAPRANGAEQRDVC